MPTGEVTSPGLFFGRFFSKEKKSNSRHRDRLRYNPFAVEKESIHGGPGKDYGGGGGGEKGGRV